MEILLVQFRQYWSKDEAVCKEGDKRGWSLISQLSSKDVYSSQTPPPPPPLCALCSLLSHLLSHVNSLLCVLESGNIFACVAKLIFVKMDIPLFSYPEQIFIGIVHIFAAQHKLLLMN